MSVCIDNTLLRAIAIICFHQSDKNVKKQELVSMVTYTRASTDYNRFFLNCFQNSHHSGAVPLRAAAFATQRQSQQVRIGAIIVCGSLELISAANIAIRRALIFTADCVPKANYTLTTALV